MADPLLEGDDFLAMNLSDSEPECLPPTTTTTTLSNTSTSTSTATQNEKNTEKPDRKALPEEAFQTLKATYRAKVENGEIHSKITLPLQSRTTKPEAQEILHAVEELYFLTRYDEALSFMRRVFSPTEGKGETHLDGEVQKLLRYYEGRCASRLSSRLRGGGGGGGEHSGSGQEGHNGHTLVSESCVPSAQNTA
ncbi:hypothetical protein QBC47DRAFT_408664 [Echria macrotheca]|uniref:Uncharacterized protein n=1 Tax=Echria macrotheca TaxID=438768 RepID=A0AAJ0FGZ4_9PEZI|nr:hypothetical protein QBC47DRAFT_408664 [Echria macrotheca]